MLLKELEQKLNNIKKDCNSLNGQIELLQSQYNEADLKLAHIETDRFNFKKAVEILDIVQQTTRALIKEGFESVVTEALKSIFGNDFIFELEFGRRGNLQEAYFLIKNKNIKEAHDPIGTLEGGATDVVSLALRTVVLELSQKTNKAPLILDECFKFVSPEYVEACGRFLEILNEKIGRQIIIVTHKPQLKQYADNVFELELNLTK